MNTPKSVFLIGLRIAMALSAAAIAGKVVSTIYDGLNQKPLPKQPQHRDIQVCIRPQQGLFTGQIHGIVMIKNGEFLSEGRVYTPQEMTIETKDREPQACFNVHLTEPVTPDDVFTSRFVYDKGELSPEGNRVRGTLLSEEKAAPSGFWLSRTIDFDPLQGFKDKYSPARQTNYVYKTGRGKEAFIFP